jgi:hypothetical protein
MDMPNFDRNDERALRQLDDDQLETLRGEMLAARDPRMESVVRVLAFRAVPVIESVSRKRGEERGLSRQQMLRVIDDASYRLMLRLRRPDRQPAVSSIAAEIATACADAQVPQPESPPKLASRRPELRVAEELGDALARGQIRRNDWSSS